MWVASKPKRALKRSVYEMIEKYELGEQRLLLESNRIKLQNFVEKLKYKPDYGSSGICSKHDANSSDETSLSRG